MFGKRLALCSLAALLAAVEFGRADAEKDEAEAAGGAAKRVGPAGRYHLGGLGKRARWPRARPMHSLGKRPRGHRYGFLGKRRPDDDDADAWDSEPEYGKRGGGDDETMHNFMTLASGMGKRAGGARAYWYTLGPGAGRFMPDY